MEPSHGVCGFIAIFAVFTAAPLAWAQDFDRVAPKPVEQAPQRGQLEVAPPKVEGSDEVLLERLRGMVFVTSPDQVQANGVATFEGVQAEGLPLLKTEKFRAVVEPYINRPVSLRSLNELARDVVLFYREQSRPIVDVFVPEQDITGGVVQIVVLEGRLGDVQVIGNKHFASNLLSSQIRTKPGEAFDASRLNADIDWLNRNPFRRVDVVLAPGTEPGLANIELQVEDHFPFRLYSGYENTGTPLTDEDRLFAGFNWGNVLGLDHQLGYQFTTSPDQGEFTAHAGTYLMPLPWRHSLSFFGSYAKSGAAVETFDMDGHSWQLGLRYAIPLSSSSKRFAHELRIGLDFKQSNNNLLFGGSQVFDVTTDVVQFVLGYDATLTDAWGTTMVDVAAFLSPGDLTGRNDREHFEQSRAGADPEYAYARLRLERATRLPADFTWLVRGEAQLATDNLLSSEQLGIGGYDTVRGYAEREANGDHGFWLSTELRTPPLHPAKLLQIKTEEGLQLLTFFDYGVVSPHDPLPDEDKHIDLASVGVGVRYAISRVLSLRYDYGWQIRDSGVSPEGRNGRHHLSLMISITF